MIRIFSERTQIISTFFALLVLGFAAPPSRAAPNADPIAARTHLESIANEMVAALQDPGVRKDAAKLNDLVVQTLVPHIDFRVASNLVLGAYWNDASEPQREAFIAEFSAFLVRFYTGALSSYVDNQEVPENGMRFTEQPKQKSEREVLVRSQVGPPGGDEINVDYRMFARDGWKVIDVSVAGISMVQSYRSHFKSTVKNKGLDHLIGELRERNRSFAAN